MPQNGCLTVGRQTLYWLIQPPCPVTRPNSEIEYITCDSTLTKINLLPTENMQEG